MYPDSAFGREATGATLKLKRCPLQSPGLTSATIPGILVTTASIGVADTASVPGTVTLGPSSAKTGRPNACLI
jgi:hypothetical protein